MIIKVLAENTSNNDILSSEHGLSLYIETENHKILFDMGQSPLFAKNAVKMGVDLIQVDVAILSHGHYDHGGGIKTFFDINSKAPLYLSKYAFETHYNASDKYIGIDVSLQNSERLIFTDGITVIDNELTLHSSSTMKLKYDTPVSGLSVKTNDILLPEDFRHEQYLMINENDKRILISGCSHKGILNITHHFKPDVLIGGFHFMKLEPDSEYLTDAANILLTYPTRFYTCHCTGIEQYNKLKTIIGNKLSYLSTGDEFAI